MFGVIMAGGRGTRFWPSSRKNNPKQLLDIIGPDSMLQMTIDRLKKINSLEDIFIVTSRELAPKIRKRVKGVNKKNIIVLLVSTFFSSIIFYISANTLSFFFDPGYLKNISGWVMANTTGLPGYPPAWLFGLKSLLSNIVFASAFYFALIPKHETVKITRIQSQEV